MTMSQFQTDPDGQPGGRCRVYSLDVETMSDAELVSAVCLQGLANRQRPRVFLHVNRRHWHGSFEANPLSEDGAPRLASGADAQAKSAAGFWHAYYADAHGYDFHDVGSFPALVQLLGDAVKGIVRFRLANRAELAPAFTVAGVEDALAVPDESPFLSALLARFPVVADLRDRFADRLEATHWAKREYFARCSHRAIFSQNDTNGQNDPDIFSLDLAVSQRLFVFNLDFWQARAPDHFALIQELLSGLDPMSPMYGWGTSEAAMMVAMAPSGTFLICTHCPNLSFHKQVPALQWPLRAKRRFAPASVRLESLHYVTFIVNEGDTLKWMGSVMGSGRWLEPERGRLPVNWGASTFITKEFPGMMEYFYQSSSELDLFVSAISGYGYYSPKHSACYRELAERERTLLPETDMTVGTIYSVHGMMDAVNGRLDWQTHDWLVRRGCQGYVFEAAQQPLHWTTAAGQPVMGADWSLFYWKHRIPGAGDEQLRNVAERIKEVAGMSSPPGFIPVYGGSPAEFVRIAGYLPPERFKIVALDEFIEAAKLAQPGLYTTSVRAFEGQTLLAPWTHEAAAGGVPFWSRPILVDLGSLGVGRMRAEVQFAWNRESLHVRVEECVSPPEPCESLCQAGFEAGEFDLVDAVGLWFDFNLDGTRERGDFTLWLGFSSTGRLDLACCNLNDRVLVSVQPRVRVGTGGQPGSRWIEAQVPWMELALLLDAEHHPVPGLPECVAGGFQFGCQPLLLEGKGGRAFLNGRSNRRQDRTAAVLEDNRGSNPIAAPNGWDRASWRVQLDPARSSPRTRQPQECGDRPTACCRQ